MTNEERCRRIAELAWDIQPKFHCRFKTVEALAKKIEAGQGHMGGLLGYFLPVSILETVCEVDFYRTTIGHAEMDEILGESSIHPDELSKAKTMVSQIGPLMPQFEEHCGAWIDD